ncbi:N-methyl-L-tryptophan oxidase [Chloroflexi bacterium]|nr:N-methyl-L-tryptophan oxidase [Chloroflexota bacterium]
MPAFATKHSDVIVVGTGAVGSAAMYYLAKNGVDVIGLDRFPVAHDKGSSHGQTRIIRLAYFEHPNYVPLLKRSFELWEELEKVSGFELYTESGLIQVGPPDGEIVAGVRESAAMHNLTVEDVTQSDLKDFYPGFSIPHGMEAVFEKRAGFLKVEKCIETFLDLADKSGAQLYTGIEVLGWELDADHRVTVTTNEGVFTADRIIVTAGAWAGELVKGLRVNLTVVRKPLFWFQSDNVYELDSGCPAFFYETPEGSFYGFPSIDELGLKVAEHTGGEPVLDPLEVDRSKHRKDEAKIEYFLQEYLTGMNAPTLTDHKVCMYTRSPDEDFIIDKVEEYPQVSYVAGLSGHGFKMASVLGEIMADMATKGSTEHPIEFLSANRFGP